MKTYSWIHLKRTCIILSCNDENPPSEYILSIFDIHDMTPCRTGVMIALRLPIKPDRLIIKGNSLGIFKDIRDLTRKFNIELRIGGLEVATVPNMDWTCAICLSGNGTETEKYVKLLCCGHIFHRQCAINVWSISSQCPLCRTDKCPFCLNENPGGC